MQEKLQHLYLTSSFRGDGVAEIVMSDIEKLRNKPAHEIKVSYITTAGNLHPADKRDWINEGREILKQRGWQVFDYDIVEKSEKEVEAELADKDVIFVQGGNNFYLLKWLHDCNFDKIIRKLLANNVPYIGESAGSIVCSEDIAAQKAMSADALGQVPDLKDFHGLGLVNFLIRPHWNSQGAKREKFSKFLREDPEGFYGISQPIICLNDNQLVYVEGDKFQILEGAKK